MREAEFDGVLEVVRVAMADGAEGPERQVMMTHDRLIIGSGPRRAAANDNVGYLHLEPFPDGWNAIC